MYFITCLEIYRLLSVDFDFKAKLYAKINPIKDRFEIKCIKINIRLYDDCHGQFVGTSILAHFFTHSNAVTLATVRATLCLHTITKKQRLLWMLSTVRRTRLMIAYNFDVVPFRYASLRFYFTTISHFVLPFLWPSIYRHH